MKWMKIVGLVFVFIVHNVCAAKPLVIGVDQINPPLSMRTDNASHFIGFEIDIMNEICSRLRVACTYQAVIANQVISALEMERIDFAINTITIPSFRLYGLILSLPYLPSYAQFLTLKNSSIEKTADIPGKVIGVRLGAFQATIDSDMYIKHMFTEPPKIKGYYTISELFAALTDREVDVVFANKYAMNYWYNINQDLYKYIGDPTYLGNGYGIMSLAKNQAMMSNMNGAIKKMMDDGTYARIYKRYFVNFK